MVSTTETETECAERQRIEGLKALVTGAIEHREASARAAMHNDMPESYRLSNLAAIYAHEAMHLIEDRGRITRREMALQLVEQSGCTHEAATWMVDRIRRFRHG